MMLTDISPQAFGRNGRIVEWSTSLGDHRRGRWYGVTGHLSTVYHQWTGGDNGRENRNESLCPSVSAADAGGRQRCCGVAGSHFGDALRHFQSGERLDLDGLGGILCPT